MSSFAPVTVLMPVYNAERYLASALESVLGQTFTEFQLLAIDDGSTDQTLSILRRYARHDVRLRIVSRVNRGLVATLNEGLHLSRSELVASLFQIRGTQQTSHYVTAVHDYLHALRVVETTWFDGLNLLAVAHESYEAASL